MKKVGKTTRPFRYDLNQIPYDYTVEVRSEIQGIRSDRVPEEVRDILQEAVIKTVPKIVTVQHMYPNVHRSTVYNSQDMETT